MKPLYNISIYLYKIAIMITSLFNLKAKEWIVGRKNIFNEIKKAIVQNCNPNHKLIWIHVSSLGEFEQARPLIDYLYKNYRHNYRIFLTFFSPSGYLIRKNYNKADYIFYLPLDTPQNAKLLVNTIKPTLVFWVKYDFWFHYLKQINKKQIPIFIIDALFKPNHYFFKWYGKFMLKIIADSTHIFVQNNKSKDLLKNHQITNCTLAGDTRFDSVLDIYNNAEKNKDIRIKTINDYCKNEPVFIAGSTWPNDELIVIKYINQNPKKWLYIIAPHETDNKHVKQIEQQINIPYIKLSTLTTNPTKTEKYNCIIVDSIGILAYLYQFANIAYIGGGFGKSIHNTQEPAIFGIPIVFGPNYQAFLEAVEMKTLKGAFSISSYNEFEQIINEFDKNPQKIITAGNTCKNYMNSKVGATMLIINYLKDNNFLN